MKKEHPARIAGHPVDEDRERSVTPTDDAQTRGGTPLGEHRQDGRAWPDGALEEKRDAAYDRQQRQQHSDIAGTRNSSKN
jgi:hypothetical protein